MRGCLSPATADIDFITRYPGRHRAEGAFSAHRPQLLQISGSIWRTPSVTEAAFIGQDVSTAHFCSHGTIRHEGTEAFGR